MQKTKVTLDDLGDLLEESPLKKKIKKKKKKKKAKVLKLKGAKNKAPLGISKKYDEAAQEEMDKWLATEAGFLEGLTSDVYGKRTRLYYYQIAYLTDPNFFIHIDKSRQTGFSYIYAGKSLARSHLSGHHTSIFISINQEEANEKIIYAKGLYESLPLSLQKRQIIDNKHSLEFEDHAGRKFSRTRIISHAQREPRGKGGNVDVYLDEAAHYTWGEQIYVAAIPIITRGEGSLTIGSTPLGKKGIHYDITAQGMFRKIYSYHQIWWWNCKEFVARGKFKEAQKKAPFMSTQERVITYGADKLVAIFISMDIEQFQQEYEILHADDSVSFFTIDLINQCVYKIVIDDIFLQDDENADSPLDYPMEKNYPSIKFELYKDIDKLLAAIQSGDVSGKLIAGYDVGRKRHSAEFCILEEMGKEHDYLQVCRFFKTFRNTKFRDQKAYLQFILDNVPRMKMQIDKGGMGSNLSEDLEDYSWRVEGIEFSNRWKEEVCSDFRIRLENQTIAIPDRKDIKNQIHSIKRKVSEHGKFIFDAEKNKRHHGDIFWSIAMASSLGEKPVHHRVIIPTKNMADPVATARIIPISNARNFPIIIKPKRAGSVDVSNLMKPRYVSALHRRIGER